MKGCLRRVEQPSCDSGNQLRFNSGSELIDVLAGADAQVPSAQTGAQAHRAGDATLGVSTGVRVFAALCSSHRSLASRTSRTGRRPCASRELGPGDLDTLAGDARKIHDAGADAIRCRRTRRRRAGFSPPDSITCSGPCTRATAVPTHLPRRLQQSIRRLPGQSSRARTCGNCGPAVETTRPIST
jgi:hypothetical protein